MNDESDRDLPQLTLNEVYEVSVLVLCLHGTKNRRFSHHYASNEILNQWTEVLCSVSFFVYLFRVEIVQF